MEAYVLVFTLAISLILTLFGFMGPRSGWGLLCLFGAAIAYLCALVISADADLTWMGTTLAAANGNFVSDFNMVAWVPIVVALGETVVGIRRVFKI